MKNFRGKILCFEKILLGYGFISSHDSFFAGKWISRIFSKRDDYSFHIIKRISK